MMGNNQNLFFSPEEKGRAFSDVLKEVQEYISSKYSTLMVEGGNDEVKQQVKRYISKYIADYRITVKGKTREELIDDLYTEMAEFSFLTKYIFGTGIEEIDINSWRDIEVQYSDGRCEKMEEHFESPEHAINVIRRMLHVSGMVLDNASPAVLGHLSKNIRIAVLKTPLVDEDVGIAGSMNLILFCVFLTFSVGLFLLLAGLLRLPTLKTSRVMMDTGKEGKQLSKTLDAFYMDGAVKIARYIRINDYKKSRMASVLRASGLGMTPEVYTAYAYLKAGSIFLLIIPALYVFPLAALFVILLGIMIYYKEIQKADEILKEKREQIEEELYRFVSTITQELKNSRDVLAMLEHYKENAGAAFRKELDIVCADMRSSSYEAALTRFEARLNSPQLSDVVRGLIGVLRGDDGAVYFQMLTHDFKQAELQRLKAKAAKIPPKIRVYSFAMLMCFLATYFAIIIYEIIKSMGTLF